VSVLSLDHLSAELRTRAAELRGAADSLVDRATWVHWSDAAADAMRRRAARGADALRVAAGRHDHAADLLDRHAAAAGGVADAAVAAGRTALDDLCGLAGKVGL